MARLARRRRGPARALGAARPRSPRDVARGGLHARAAARAWAARASARRCCQLTFGRSDGLSRSSTCSTRPIRRRSSAREREVDLARTLFIVSSKSGTTLEPNIFEQYFFERVPEAVGARGGRRSRFIAITDPGSKLEQRRRGRRASATSRTASSRSAGATRRCRTSAWCRRGDGRRRARAARPRRADGARLRRLRAGRGQPRARARRDRSASARSRGRDKLTLVASPAIGDLGAWLEQLLAESTGKEGKGVIPVDREPLGAPDVYGDDRLFVYVRLGVDARRRRRTRAVEALERGRAPGRADRARRPLRPRRRVLPLGVRDRGRGRGARHQPVRPAGRRGVQDRDARAHGPTTSRPARCPPRRRSPVRRRLKLFADERNAPSCCGGAAATRSRSMLRAHLGRVGDGDYVALLAYVEMTRRARAGADRDPARRSRPHASGHLRRLRPALPALDRPGLQGRARTPASSCRSPATTPRDLPVPGQKYTFGVVKAAQARGDFQVLAERGRRALRVHLGEDVDAGLAAIREAVEQRAAERRGGRKVMQLGMVGLGRMGANIVRRLMRRRPRVRRLRRRRRKRSRRSSSEGATGAASLDDFVAKLAQAARRLGHGAGRVRRRRPSTSSRRAWSRATSSSTAATATTATTSTAPRRSGRRASTTSTSARAAASSGSSAASA